MPSIAVLYITSAACGGFILLEFFTIVYQLTTVLERGRVISGILVSVVMLGPLLYIAINVPFVEWVLIAYQIFYITFIFQRKLQGERFSSPLLHARGLLDRQVVKYTIILSGFGFIEGLFFRARFLGPQLIDGPFSFLVLPSILIVSLLAAGIIFDLYGRRRSLSLILLLLGTHALLTRVEEATGGINVSSGLFSAALVMSLVALLTIIADISIAPMRVMPLVLICIAGALIAGFAMQAVMQAIDVEFTYFAGLLGVIMIAIVLINTGDSLPKMETEWNEGLVSMYVMHSSGLLLFHHDFPRSRKDRDTGQGPGPEPDLVSSGLVGITQLLQEIMQGKQIIRAIDHFSKKILLEEGNSVIVALIVARDLRVLREKTRKFIEAFELEYSDDLEVNGVDVSRYHAAAAIVNKYFQVRYLGEQ